MQSTGVNLPPLSESAARATHPRRRDRATYRGSCQVCGRLQKLPAGVLSKHGYTKRWGFFEGTCPGAHYRPFEVAFDRVQHSIDRTKDQVAGLRSYIAKLQDLSTVTDKAPYQTYDRMGRMGYYETEVTVIEEPVPGREDLKNIFLIETRGEKTIRHIGSQHGFFHGVADAILRLRGMKIGRLQKEIEQRERYIAWQERRIAEWKPCELQPVQEEA